MSYYHLWKHGKDFSELVGKTLASVEVAPDNDEIRFVTDKGEHYMMYHTQDCCESVSIESIVGDLQDLIGSPILKAEESKSDKNPSDANPETIEWQESFTWTFYKLATIKGYVDIRWYGSSNGYYSEAVEFALIPKEELQ